MANLNPEQTELLKNLTYKRGQIKGKLTRFKSFLDSSLDLNLMQLKIRVNRIQESLNEFEQIQAEIESLDQSETQSEERDLFETLYFELVAQGREYLINREAPHQGVTHKSEANSIATAPQVRLPPINLPTFSGSYEEWMSFSDSFQSLIRDNETLSEIQKFHYLKSSLNAEAAHVISALELTSANYEVAWSLLESRYKNTKVIIQRHVKALFDLPCIEKESASSLRQLIDGTLSHIRSLNALNQPTQHWDTLIVHLLTTKLNNYAYKEWENSTKPDELPKLQELLDFLQRRCQILENTSRARQPQTSHSNKTAFPSQKQKQTFISTSNKNSPTWTPDCRICKGNHFIINCPKLKTATHEEKVKTIKAAGLCLNCLRPGHVVKQCRSGGCRVCSARHNTMLHFEKDEKPDHPTTKQPSESSLQSYHLTSIKDDNTQVLLSTALIQVIAPNGISTKCRALLDNGSQTCFMTESVAQALCLRKSKCNINILGIDECQVQSRGVVEARIRSTVSSYSTQLAFVVVPKITGQIPSRHVDMRKLNLPNHVVLADPSFSAPGHIDILLGQEIFLDLLCIGQIKIPNMPTIQKTRLGWIVGGRYQSDDEQQGTNATACYLSTATDRIDKTLEKFWLIEEPTHTRHMTAEELACEEHYETHTKRNSDGRYTVKMPLRCEATVLGDSKRNAVNRFMQIERRLERQPDLKRDYTEFMNEYIELGHMSKLNEDLAVAQEPEYFLPHHPVVKETSTTTKVRVVFDASAKTASGVSLNNIQLVGPVVQDDIFSIVTRFRMHSYAMTADLEKMYRQILIDDSQTNLLKIVWREDSSQPLNIFKLNTVTYGTSSASHLATRTLNRLAEDEEDTFPDASAVVKRDFYVDDLLTGTNSKEDAVKLQAQLVELLARGGFNLRKWNSNSSALLETISKEHHEGQQTQFLCTGESSKTLGIVWDTGSDTFRFHHTSSQKGGPWHFTKRKVLSEIAKLFDPLGIVAPVIIRAKILMQEMWKMKIGWDESLPAHLHTRWTQFRNCLELLSDVSIARQVTIHRAETASFQLHGFSDASERAYGAAVYFRHTDPRRGTKVSLLCSKSRVAPLHSTSLPRLELCAALLLAELVAHVQRAIGTLPTTYWCDSTVVLAWINSEPARWVTFVANRVAKIQTLTREGRWRHVRTDQNPADLVSRGTHTRELKDLPLWWVGPSWLSLDSKKWPELSPITTEEIPEERLKNATSLAVTRSNEVESAISIIIEKYSSFSKMARVLALCLRFAKNCKTERSKRNVGALSLEEVIRARDRIIKHVQGGAFPTDPTETAATRLTKKFASLTPFIDREGLVRVGGRLTKSKLSFDAKHPILLPMNHKITTLIAHEEHLRQLHCGPQALLYALRQRYWPINGRSLTRKIVHKCITCLKARPIHRNQLMADLPADRVTPARPFLHTGVDYCGPFLIKTSRRRNSGSVKSYVAVFVCLATKALHLELVSDLTTDAFVAALRRFVSRRGVCSTITSDNGKNFVGANRQLKELRDFFTAEAHTITEAASREGISWRFIPPYAPHMGGLWEAAVKSLKHHLRRITGQASLTFEELSTLITQVEAVLNSRPITPLSDDPTDLSALTPAHFLIGGPLTGIPEPSLMEIPEGRLSRWQRLQKLLQHFWSRWSKEYLCSLQQRTKWRKQLEGPSIGQLVILKEDHSPPVSWPLGRIISLHPGSDGLVRVITVKTAAGEVKRSVNRLCPLPIEG